MRPESLKETTGDVGIKLVGRTLCKTSAAAMATLKTFGLQD